MPFGWSRWALLACWSNVVAFAGLGAIADAALAGSTEAARHINTLLADDIPASVSSANETCEYVDLSTTPSAFCSMVKYPAVVATSIAEQDRDAATMYAFFDDYLRRFNCNVPYSPIMDCDDCRDAYQYWACALQFPRCRPGNNATAECSVKSYAGVASEPPASECRQLPCLSICQDVVRKCPDMLRFFCPLPATYVNLPPYEAEGVHYPDYSADIADCNKLDRVTDPVDVAEVDGLSADDFPWPGSFDSAA